MEPPLLPRLSDYVTHWAAEMGTTEAAVMGDLRLTWNDLARDVDACAKGLLGAGVAHGDRVALLGNPRPEFLVVYLATASVGAVFQGLNPKYSYGELLYVAGDARPVLLFDLVGDEATANRLRADTPSIRDVVAWHEGTATSYTAFLAAGHGVQPDRLHAARATVDTLDPMALVYTSGSTGRPKGALLPHRGLTYCSTVQADHWVGAPAWRVVCNLPINHVGCLGDLCAASIVAGGTLVFRERFDAEELLHLIEKERIDLWGAVPAMFALSAQTPSFPTADLTSLRRIIWSGGAMPIGLARQLQARCATVANSYGLTESVGSVTYTDDDADLETKCVTIGRPDPRYEVRIATSDGTECSIDEPGEILVRGDFVMRGYLNRPEATAEAIDAHGWLHTGDVATRRGDGNLVLLGRMQDMFKSGGYNVYPTEIETALEKQPSVTLAAVLGVPDAVYGEVGHAFVLGSPTALTAHDLRAFAKERLANYKVPKHFTIASELPMLPIGKIDKLTLRQQLDKGR